MTGRRVQSGVTDEEVAVAEPDSAGSIGRRAGRGLRWALIGNLVLKVGSFALSLAMVRLLAPHDFGLYAVALAANAFLIHVNRAVVRPGGEIISLVRAYPVRLEHAGHRPEGLPDNHCPRVDHPEHA